ncbi:MAG TPA: WXG100 family type VII secretion target [Candidatus Dietzia merdigallinarum]|nr:WXG100 family type VII secretion target [Candidatus Dietzia merdigallinarum]
MSDGRITYNHGAIEGLVAQVGAASDALRDKLDHLGNYLQPLVQEWEGDAGAAYLDHQTAWNESAAALQSMLSDIARAAQEANMSMANADRMAARGWG